jgi:hypothetical protein
LPSLRQQLYKINCIAFKTTQRKTIDYKTVEEYINMYEEVAAAFETY